MFTFLVCAMCFLFHLKFLYWDKMPNLRYTAAGNDDDDNDGIHIMPATRIFTLRALCACVCVIFNELFAMQVIFELN